MTILLSHRSVPWLVLGVTMLVRTLVAATYPLVPDETYFWEWSRRLAPGYYDHPPAIAWVIAAGTAVLGDTVLGVRLVPLLCNVVAAVALIIAARDIAGEPAAIRASVVFALLPLSSALILATPDAPLAAAAALATLAVLRATDPRTPAPRAFGWWLVAGTCTACAVMTKLSGAIVPLGVAVASALVPGYRTVFRSAGPYVACAVTLAAILPALQWNAAHDWVAVRFQVAHSFGSGADSAATDAIRRVLEFIGGQLLVTAVLPGAAMVGVLARGARGTLGARAQFLAAMTVTAFGIVLLAALRRHSEPNWTAVGYPPLIVLFAAAGTLLGDWRNRWGFGIAGVAVALAYASAIVAYELPSVGRLRNPMAQAYGWRDLALAAQQRAAASAGGSAAFLAANNYQDASQIAFHADGQPTVFSLNIAGRRNQYDYWPQFFEVASTGDLLVLVLDELAPESAAASAAAQRPVRHRVIERLAPHFLSVTPDTLVSHAPRGRLVLQRRLWVLRHWRGTWPE